MASFSILTLFAWLIAATSQTSLGPYNDEQELFVYHQQIFAVHQLLHDECPELIRLRREVDGVSMMPLRVEVAKIVYEKLLEALKDCRGDETTGQSVEAQRMTTQLRELPTATPPTTERLPIPRDCQQLYERGSRSSGVYLIDPLYVNIEPFPVWCDFIAGHGWTVFQKRFNGSVDFYRNWTEYRGGFGSLAGEHWLGLEKLYALTRSNQQLNIIAKTSNGIAKSGTWASFYIHNEVDNYRLEVNAEGYVGTLPSNSLEYHHGMAFSTNDKDNDLNSGNCAQSYHGAWWYKSCYHSNLNGGYNTNNSAGIVWNDFSSYIVETVMRVSRD